MRFNPMFKAVSWLVVLAFMWSGVAFAYPIARIIPYGKVNVYQDGELLQVLQEEAPLPEGASLHIEGKCAVRMNDLYFVVQDGGQFSTQTGEAVNQVTIENGTFYFAAIESTGPVAFNTPSGTIRTDQVALAAGDELAFLRGYVNVSQDTTQMGVLGGGTLTVATAKGLQSIATGEQLTLAKAGNAPAQTADDRPDAAAPVVPGEEVGTAQAAANPPGAAPPVVASEEVGSIPAAYLIGGGLGVAAIAGLVFAFSGSSSSGSNPPPVSPAAP
jgi:hypothetical protein